jgi:nucleotide-binding universal stress UspA family protein
MQVKDGYPARLDHADLRAERRIVAVVANRGSKGIQGCGSIMIKDIVANLSVGISRDVATEFAVSVAATLDSHVTGIAFRYEPLVPLTDRYGFPAEVMDSQRAENEKRAKAAMAAFDEAARRAAVSAQSHMLEVPVASAHDVFAKVARRFDLAIMGQAEPDTPALERLLVEAALFDSGRPVLIVPYIQRKGLTLDRVLVAWDGSRSAARAVADAMPLLVRAKATEVLTVASEPAKSDEMPGADIAHHLARHGVEVEVDSIVTVETDVASTILSHAADISADVLVMGGYGHSRLREFVLGGVTRGILESMTIPTLMSH